MKRGYVCPLCEVEIPPGSRNFMKLADGTITHARCGDPPRDAILEAVFRAVMDAGESFDPDTGAGVAGVVEQAATELVNDGWTVDRKLMYELAKSI